MEWQCTRQEIVQQEIECMKIYFILHYSYSKRKPTGYGSFWYCIKTKI